MGIRVHGRQPEVINSKFGPQKTITRHLRTIKCNRMLRWMMMNWMRHSFSRWWRKTKTKSWLNSCKTRHLGEALQTKPAHSILMRTPPMLGKLTRLKRNSSLVVMITIELRGSIVDTETTLFILHLRECSSLTAKYQQSKQNLTRFRETITHKLSLTRWYPDSNREWVWTWETKDTSRCKSNSVLSSKW